MSNASDNKVRAHHPGQDELWTLLDLPGMSEHQLELQITESRRSSTRAGP